MIKNATTAWMLALVTLTACEGPQSSVPSPHQGIIELDQRTVAFETNGRLLTVEVVRGQKIVVGQRIATIDGPLLPATRAARAADLEAAKAQLALLEGGAKPEDIAALQAQVRSLQASERTIAVNLGREKQLVADHAAPAATLDDLSGKLSAAKAQREALQHQLAGVKSGARTPELDAARARIAAATAALDLEDRRAALLTLVAPVAGTVLDVIADPGEVVGAGTPVVVVGDEDHPYVDVFVATAALGPLAVGQRAQVLVDGIAPSAATIEHIATTTEFTPRFVFSRDERQHLVVRVRLRIEDPSHYLHPGLPAFAVFANAPGVASIPLPAAPVTP